MGMCRCYAIWEIWTYVKVYYVHWQETYAYCFHLVTNIKGKNIRNKYAIKPKNCGWIKLHRRFSVYGCSENIIWSCVSLKNLLDNKKSKTSKQ